MPITRRQSGKLPPTRNLHLPEDDGTDAEDHNRSEYEDQATDRDEEKQSKPKARKRKGGHAEGDQPAAKRARKTANSTSTKAKQKKGASLSKLRELPLDVLYEILGLLTPKDLVNMAVSSKAFYRTLVDGNATGVWRSALRSMHDHVPECPQDMSVPQWANLLFGGTNCFCCGTSNVQRIDFILGRRLCTKCMKANLVYAGSLPRKYPNINLSILELLPHTNTGGWAHGHTSKSKYYWKSDILAMSRTCKEYRDKIDMRLPGARQAFDNFRKERAEHVKYVLEIAPTHTKWHERYLNEQLEASRERKERRYEDILRRFQELGYDARDISYIKLQVVEKDNEVTDRVWSNLRLQLEPVIKKRQMERLVLERAHMISERQAVVLQAYKDYQKTLVPIQRLYVPRVEDIWEIPQFATLINDPSDDNIDLAACRPGVEALSEYITAWNNRTKQHLLGTLLLAKRTDAKSNPQESSATVSPSSHAQTERLSQATCVFRCNHHSDCQQTPLFSSEEVISHRHRMDPWTGEEYISDPSELHFAFCRRGSEAVASLLEVLGLDADETQPGELDRLDARFVCLKCPIGVYNGGLGRAALSWRSCVSHFIGQSTHDIPEWQHLQGEDLADVKRREDIDRTYLLNMWSCNHCQAHADGLALRTVVVEHVQESHGISDPEEGQDFFCARPYARVPLKPVCFSMGPQSERRALLREAEKVFMCMHCPVAKHRFCGVGIRNHLQAKHRISDAEQDRDFRR